LCTNLELLFGRRFAGHSDCHLVLLHLSFERANFLTKFLESCSSFCLGFLGGAKAAFGFALTRFSRSSTILECFCANLELAAGNVLNTLRFTDVT
jgi:hypothetical protein